MYISPNGMTFDSYEDSMEYNRKMIQKEFNDFFNDSGFSRVICSMCHGECAKLDDRNLYICMRCGGYTEVDDESES